MRRVHALLNFCALPALCAGDSPVAGEFPSQKPVTRSFGVFFHLCLNKRLSKQLWGWWFETPSGSLWRHCDVTSVTATWTMVFGCELSYRRTLLALVISRPDMAPSVLVTGQEVRASFILFVNFANRSKNQLNNSQTFEKCQYTKIRGHKDEPIWYHKHEYKKYMLISIRIMNHAVISEKYIA